MGLKTMVDKQIERFNRIKVCHESNKRDESSSSSEDESDSDFEDVPEKEGYEAEATSPPLPAPLELPSTSRSSVNKSLATSSKSWRLWNVEREDANVS